MLEGPPAHFEEETFRECLELVEQNYDDLALVQSLIVRLAKAAGGEALAAAVDKYAFPPCKMEDNCGKCWAIEWCIHKFTSKDNRARLLDLESILTDPNGKGSIWLESIAKKSDKTNPQVIRRLGLLSPLSKGTEE